jgi:hypothetical protein
MKYLKILLVVQSIYLVFYLTWKYYFDLPEFQLLNVLCDICLVSNIVCGYILNRNQYSTDKSNSS